MSARISALLGGFWTARADANLVDGKDGDVNLRCGKKDREHSSKMTFNRP